MTPITASSGPDCGNCHVPDDWKQVSFDHNQAAFKLLGRHATVDCAACHTNDNFKGTPQDCNACHAKDDHHNGQFGTDCGKCHVPDDWKQATFDHNLSPLSWKGCTRPWTARPAMLIMSFRAHRKTAMLAMSKTIITMASSGRIAAPATRPTAGCLPRLTIRNRHSH